MKIKRRAKMKMASTMEIMMVCEHVERKMKPSHCGTEWIELRDVLQVKEASQEGIMVERVNRIKFWA